MRRVFVVHGVNLNLLGTREPAIYGVTTLEEINRQLAEMAHELGLELRCFQSNSEGEIVSAIQASAEWAHVLIINAGAYTHTSLAIADAIQGVGLPAIEVHLSNIYARESFRHHSYLSRICVGTNLRFWRQQLPVGTPGGRASSGGEYCETGGTMTSAPRVGPYPLA